MATGHISDQHISDERAIDQRISGHDIGNSDVTGRSSTGGSDGDRPPLGTAQATRYLAPDAISRRIANPLMRALVQLGFGVRGGRILHVRGRRSGQWRTTPVNPLAVDGERYLVAPRGRTEWVRNLRAAGAGRFQLGRRFEEFTATEIDDAGKAPIIRAYLDRWAMETKRFFEGLDATSRDEDIAAVASGFPVFRIEAPTGA